MRIEDEIKLTFDDVLIRPKRSTLVSRAEVELNREFKFRHSSEKWTGIPIFSANMDTTGTFETAKVLQSHNMLTAVHKFYTLNEWEENLKESKSGLSCCDCGHFKRRLSESCRCLQS